LHDAVLLSVFAPTYGEMERLIVANLHRIRALGSGVIVHLPRSGTAPAGMIATYLPAPLASVDEYCAGIVPDRKCPPYDRNLVILVDDCINQGKQATAAIDRILGANRKAFITLVAIYDCARDGGKGRNRPFPMMTFANHHGGNDKHYLYPYYIWKSPRLKHCAVDFDGVLCRDATRDEDDDGPAYRHFLAEVEPKFLPLGYEIGAIVTARCEKYRADTVAWLARHGVKYGALHMGPWPGKDDRAGGMKAAKWKASVYAGLGPDITLFIESSVVQAREINVISGKPVFDVETMKLHMRD
jgi:orotate phosphoribosyltransferase